MSMQAIAGTSMLLGSTVLAAIALRGPADVKVLSGLTAASAFFGILGVATLVLPSPVAERLRRGDDTWELTPMQMITRRWWCVITLAAIVAAAIVVVIQKPRWLTMINSAQVTSADNGKK